MADELAAMASLVSTIVVRGPARGDCPFLNAPSGCASDHMRPGVVGLTICDILRIAPLAHSYLVWKFN
jgi:hypothetical protein